MRREMAEKRRYLYTWPCGCRNWTVASVDGDIVKDEVGERVESCREFTELLEREGFAELEAARAFSEHGKDSPEYKRASAERADVAAKIELHPSPEYRLEEVGS
jgi:hypothetical protein